MLTWKELDKEFSQLKDSYNSVRLQVSWGSTPDNLYLSGYFDVTTKQRFLSLSKIAGEKLRQNLKPINDDYSYLLQESDPVILWHKALWKFSPSFENELVGYHKSKSGEDLGPIFNGVLKDPYKESANLALNCYAEFGETEKLNRIQAQSEDIIDIKPNFYGIGLNLNAGWRRIKSIFTGKKI